MPTETDKIIELFIGFSKAPITVIDKLPQAGSERHYFRIRTWKKILLLLMVQHKRNDAFIYFRNTLKRRRWLQHKYCVSIKTRTFIYRKILKTYPVE
jgi:hypothetical protein